MVAVEPGHLLRLEMAGSTQELLERVEVLLRQSTGDAGFPADALARPCAGMVDETVADRSRRRVAHEHSPLGRWAHTGHSGCAGFADTLVVSVLKSSTTKRPAEAIGHLTRCR